MNDYVGTHAFEAARNAAETATDAGLAPADIFASVGCVWADAREAARSAAAAMASLLSDEVPASEQIESSWLNGLLVGLFVSGPTSRLSVDGAVLVSALNDLGGSDDRLSAKLRRLGLDPAAAEEAATSVGLTASRRDGVDGVADLEWTAAQAGAWLDGLMVAVRARSY
jgi:hypothetical protein